jgi:protein SCO1/2
VKNSKKISLRAGIIVWAVGAAILSGCQGKKEESLPIFHDLITREVNGQEVIDTVDRVIRAFEFVNQDSAIITNETFNGKIYVSDFFFTSCRTICPIMKTQMLRVYERVKADPEVLLLSHTIDPEYDTVGLLHDFATRLGVASSKWHFATGQSKDYVFDLAQKSYLLTAMEDKSEPDGFIHSGAFMLIDKQGRIRGKYDGTKEEDVNRLLTDIKRLEEEYE